MDGGVAAAPEGPAEVEAAPRAQASPADLHALVLELRSIVGDEWVYTQEHQLRTYESDGLLQYHVVPAAAVLPGTAEEVQAIVRACARAGVPWVARGAGSGLSGGALPIEDGVLVVVSRMKRVLEIDLENHRICVEPGVTNSNVSAVVGPAFFYPPDPSSQIVCSIGGNVAENSGGAHCFKYGFTTNYVTGLEVVLADGEMVQIGGVELDHPGYDLLGRVRRLGGHARRRHEDLAADRAIARDRQDAGRVLRLHARGRRGGVADRAGRRRARRDRDDGRARDRRLGADGPRRLSQGPRGGAARGARRRGARVRGALRRGRRDLRALRLRRRPGREGRGGAGAVLEDAQGRLPGDGPHLPQLLRPGRRDPAHQAARGARAHRRAGPRVRDDRRQRLPRRRRQPAPAGLLRRPQGGRGRAGRGAVREDPRRAAWRPAGRSPASTASASTRRSTCRRCSPSRTSTRSSGCAARSTPPGSPTRAR